MNPAPGWYPDPSGAAPMRWWDGTGWSGHTSVAATYPSPSPFVAPTIDIDGEVRRARWARAALLAAIPSMVGTAIAMHVQLRGIFDQIGTADTAPPVLAHPGLFARFALQVPTTLTSVIAVLFLLWFAKSAANSEALGLAARREPAAAVAGFIVPIISLWWPYQSTCDLMPADNPQRPLILGWFLLWLVGGFVGMVVLLVSLFTHGATAWLLATVPVLLTTLAALAARAVIAEVVAAHEALARR